MVANFVKTTFKIFKEGEDDFKKKAVVQANVQGKKSWWVC